MILYKIRLYFSRSTFSRAIISGTKLVDSCFRSLGDEKMMKSVRKWGGGGATIFRSECPAQ